MKKIIYSSIAALLLVFTACQNDSQVVGPQSSETGYTAQAEPNWIGLPENAQKSLAKVFSASDFITAADGGQLVIDETYTSTTGTEVHTYSSIYFAPGCTQQDAQTTMEIDDETGVSTFLPHQYFNFPAILNQTFTGLDLTGLDPNNIKLYYLATDGNYEVMECDQLIIDIEAGSITVVNGQIPHFSLFGFAD